MRPSGSGEAGARLYTRAGCHLCYALRRSARRAARRHGVPLLEVDVDGDPDLRARHGEDVPVLEVPGEPSIRGRATGSEVEEAFRRAAGRRAAAAGPARHSPPGWLRRIVSAAAARFGR